MVKGLASSDSRESGYPRTESGEKRAGVPRGSATGSCKTMIMDPWPVDRAGESHRRLRERQLCAVGHRADRFRSRSGRPVMAPVTIEVITSEITTAGAEAGYPRDPRCEHEPRVTEAVQTEGKPSLAAQSPNAGARSGFCYSSMAHPWAGARHARQRLIRGSSCAGPVNPSPSGGTKD